MTQYTPDSLLQDARLQVESLGEGCGVLIVEGDDDKRFLAPRWAPISNIVVGNGKALVVGAHAVMLAKDRGRILFVVDCDDDVARGTLRGATDLIITTHADLEADLVAHGALRAVVAQVVSGALASEVQLIEITDLVLQRASACTVPLGRLRRAARRAGIALEFQPWDFDYSRVRTSGSDEVDEVELRAELQRRANLLNTQVRRIEREIEHTRDDYSVCNGKDVITAAACVLRQGFGVTRRKVENLPELIRLGLDAADFENWDLVRRVRAWERSHDTQVLGLG